MGSTAEECGIRRKSSAWYESISPLRVDLVGDLAGKELFVIHGDALMLYCITKANVDLQGKSTYSLAGELPTAETLITEGYQLLHAVHAVESFLYKLKERNCNFHIVWIRDHEGFVCLDMCRRRSLANTC